MLQGKIHQTIHKFLILSASIAIFFLIIILGQTNTVHNTAKTTNLDILNNKEQYLNSAMNQVLAKQHPASTNYKRKFQEICISNILTCIKIDFDGDFSYKEKYFYLSSSIYIIDFIDQNSSTQNLIRQKLSLISINKGDGKRRGYATDSMIEINLEEIKSYEEYIRILTHELGHVYLLSVLEGSTSKLDPNYTEFQKKRFAIDHPGIKYFKINRDNETEKRDNAQKEHFCSGYGQTDIHEDFAECFTTYITNNSLFKYRAKQNPYIHEKYKFFANLFDDKFLFQSNNALERARNNPTRRPRDDTKINW